MISDYLNTTTPTRNRFAVPGSTEEVQQRLKEQYNYIVLQRHGYAPNDGDNAAAIAAAAQWLTDATMKRNLLIVGGVGTGKSTLAGAIAAMLYDEYGGQFRETLKDAQRKDHEKGMTGHYERMIAFYDEKGWPLLTCSAFQLVNAVSQDEGADFARLTRAQFCIIDDIGTEPTEINQFGTRRRPFAELVSERYNSAPGGLVLTSNLPFDKLAEQYGPRTGDRLREMCEVLAMTSTSFRK